MTKMEPSLSNVMRRQICQIALGDEPRVALQLKDGAYCLLKYSDGHPGGTIVGTVLNPDLNFLIEPDGRLNLDKSTTVYPQDQIDRIISSFLVGRNFGKDVAARVSHDEFSPANLVFALRGAGFRREADDTFDVLLPDLPERFMRELAKEPPDYKVNPEEEEALLNYMSTIKMRALAGVEQTFAFGAFKITAEFFYGDEARPTDDLKLNLWLEADIEGETRQVSLLHKLFLFDYRGDRVLATDKFNHCFQGLLKGSTYSFQRAE